MSLDSFESYFGFYYFNSCLIYRNIHINILLIVLLVVD